MKILLFSIADNGGGCYWFSDIINKYTKHEARAIRWVQSYINYPYDFLSPGDDEFASLIKWADILHTRDSVKDNWPCCSPDKKFVVTWTGTIFRQNAVAQLGACNRRLGVATVSTPDLVAYSNGVTWLPNPREEMQRDNGSDFIVCHAPTHRGNKGTQSIIDACKKSGVPLELIERSTYVDTLKRKAKCSVLIDQFAFGYGNNAIEAWAMGIPVISGATDTKYQKTTTDSFGQLPYMDCGENVTQITESIEKMRDSNERKKWIELGQEYFFKFHHAPVVARRAVEIYERALDVK